MGEDEKETEDNKSRNETSKLTQYVTEIDCSTRFKSIKEMAKCKQNFDDMDNFPRVEVRRKVKTPNN